MREREKKLRRGPKKGGREGGREEGREGLVAPEGSPSGNQAEYYEYYLYI